MKQTNIRQHKATSATELNSIKTTHSITSHSVGPKKMKNSVFVCSPQKLIYGASRQNSVAAFSWRTEPAGGPKTNKMAPHSSAALRKTSRKSPPTFMIFANAPVWWFLPTECECLSYQRGKDAKDEWKWTKKVQRRRTLLPNFALYT